MSSANIVKPRILFELVGSYGDVFPFLTLAKHLQNLSWEVAVSAHSAYESAVRSFSESAPFHYYLLHESLVDVLRDTEEGKAMVHAKASTMLECTKKVFGRCTKTWGEDIKHHVRDFNPNVIVFSTFAEIAARAWLSENAATPSFPRHIVTHTVPTLPTSAFAPATLNMGTSFAFGFMNKWAWGFIRSMGTKIFGDITNGLSTPDTTPQCFIYSSQLLPKPKDWPQQAHVVGTLLAPPSPSSSSKLSAEVESFISTDLRDFPLIYIGFGSMLGSVFSDEEASALLQTCVRSVLKLAFPVRAILHIAGLSATAKLPVLPADNANNNHEKKTQILITRDYIHHDKLFPHCDLIIHHGGAGSVQASLLYALPTHVQGEGEVALGPAMLVLPCATSADQPFWGAIVEKLGCGKKGPVAKNATVENLTPKMTECLRGDRAHSMRKTVAKICLAMRQERGVDNIADIITRLRA